MNHKISKKKLGRTSSHRAAMLSNMAASLIKCRRIKTTLPKAKALRPFVEKLVTKSRKDDLSTYRLILSRVKDKSAADILCGEISKKYIDRNGGYTRIMKFGFRAGDNAPMALIEFV